MNSMQNLNSLELKKVVLIAASTGGPGQVQKILMALPTLRDTAVIIAQHMASDFMSSYAKRSEELTKNRLLLVRERMLLEAGVVYILQGEMELLKSEKSYYFAQKESHGSLYNPNIDLFFHSLTSFVGEFEMLCVILTGIGSDGILGCKRLAQLGVSSLTESATSAIVDGMPSRARESVPNIKVLEMSSIVEEVGRFCR